MAYSVTLAHRHFAFPDLRDLMAKATPPRSGDQLAGLAAESSAQRVAAQTLLADVPLTRFLEDPLVPYETDEVTRLILDTHDKQAFAPVRDLTVGQLREHFLTYETTAPQLTALAPGLTPEMAAAVSKICRNQDLILIASKCQITTRFRSTLGLPGRLSTRLQPNHPTDDPKAIAASVLDGLLYASGDACIGINPATDSLANTITLLNILRDLITEYDIPTQSCILSHVTTTMQAIEQGAPVDLVFQSIAGTEAANKSFGISLALLKEAHAAATEGSGFRVQGSANTTNPPPPSPEGASNPDRQSASTPVGEGGGEGRTTSTAASPCLNPEPQTLNPPNVMYFETGQGSALSANAHHNVDQQTLEARAYAVARAFSPLLVNTVVGFIGPEYLYDGKQILRAGLEDHFCGKLLGLPMGCDVCYTNHAEADQDDMDTLLTCLAAANITYIMGVPGADDVMLNYQSTSHHDAHYLRQVLNKRPAPEFEAWLERTGILNQRRLCPIPEGHRLLAAVATAHSTDATIEA
jgi:ethanolamine ammonia-lyase large subunit